MKLRLLGLVILNGILLTAFMNCGRTGFEVNNESVRPSDSSSAPGPHSSPTPSPAPNPAPGPGPSPVPNPTPVPSPGPTPENAILGDPQNFKSKISSLKPGDVLLLKPGKYPTFYVSNLRGTSDAWIRIESQDPANPAVIEGNPDSNVIEVRNSSHVALRNLKIDGMNNGGSFGISAGGGDGGVIHDILIEGNEFVRFSGSQQQVAISTKATTWNWIIRGNRIMDAGTGLYLGNSNGSYAFIGGVIENNLIQNTLGYNMQIKFQTARASIPGLPTSPQKTLIRHNVFIKANLPSPDGARPNLLLGGFPGTGPGSEDIQEVYGNFFYDNPTGESHIQASGRVSIHHNIFVKGSSAAIRLQNHDAPLKLAHVFNNTIYDVSTGISVGSAGQIETRIVGNMIFASVPISGSPTVNSGNMTGAIAAAASYFNAPSSVLGSMDFFLKSGTGEGSALDMTAFSGATDYNKDFNGTATSSFVLRGAYSGQGVNPGWKLNRELKK